MFEGPAIYDTRAITIDGSLRVTSLIEGEEVYTLRPPRRRTLPLHIVREIVWSADPE